MTIPSAYLPSTGYMRAIVNNSLTTIDLGEHYIKQSGRTRCMISSMGRTTTLVVPVSAAEGYDQLAHVPMSEVRVAYQQRWQHQHAIALQSTYGSTPYFDYYGDLLLPIYEVQYTRLWELNKALLDVILRLMEIEPDRVTYTYQFTPEKMSFADFERDSDDHMSILDLLMQKGPETRLLLKRSL